MSILLLDSAQATGRAHNAIGTDDGAGACLANTYEWFGGPSWSSVGPGAGKFGRAIDAWDYAAKRHPDIMGAPAGVPVYFGTDTPRTDANAKAGDVGLSLGNGFGIFTDSPSGRPGVMSFAARAAQVRRNMLGWTEDFLGHDTSAGVQYAQGGASSPLLEVTIISKKGSHMDLVWIGKDCWVVDWGKKTKWNVAAGTLPTATARLSVLKNMGYTEYPDQPSWLLSGFTDITK